MATFILIGIFFLVINAFSAYQKEYNNESSNN